MKKLITILFILLLSGCSQPIQNVEIEQGLGGGVVTKEFKVGGERVLIGGEQLLGAKMDSVKDFKPEVKLEKWGDETYIRVWSDEKGDKTAKQEDGKIKWNTPEKEFNFYTTTFEGNEAFEYEIILKEKPKSNVITLNIETKDLVFYYQPELTQKEIDEGAIRPENVVGSYAVYHSIKNGHLIGSTNYKTGKAFHIYRPQMQDAKGNKVWGELLIENGIMSVTIPQGFLDKATYPVKHAMGATFGITDIGASQGFNTTTWTIGGEGVLSEDGTVTQISVYLTSPRTPPDLSKAAIYTLSGSTLSYVSGSISNEITLGPANQWNDYTLSKSLTAGTYWLLMQGDGAAGLYYYTAYDAGTDETHEQNTNYANFPDATQTYDSQARLTSIYATYTPPPSPTAITDIATSSSQTSVNFKGSVVVEDDDGGDASFEYGITEAFGATTTPETISGNSTFYFNQTGLTTLTPYYYRSAYDATGYYIGDTYLVMAGDVATTTQIEEQWGKGTSDEMEVSEDSLIITLAGSAALVDTESYEVNLGDWFDSDSNGTACWTRDSGGTPSNPTGPDHAEDGSYYMFTEVSGTTQCRGATYYDTIEYTLSGEVDGYVDFYYHMFGASMGKLALEAEIDSSWVEIWSQDGAVQANSAAAYIQVTTPDTDWEGATAIRFYYDGASSYYGDAAIDFVKVYEASPEATTGTWTSLSTDLSDITNADASKIECATTTPANTELSLYTGINSSVDTPPTSWDLTYCGVTIPNATGDLSSNYLWSKIIATSTDGIANVAVDWLTYGINTGAAAEGTNTQINIGDAWKAIDGMQINIGDAWKAVEGAQINIGDSWETIY